jgi:hypothetical protein
MWFYDAWRLGWDFIRNSFSNLARWVVNPNSILLFAIVVAIVLFFQFTNIINYFQHLDEWQIYKCETEKFLIYLHYPISIAPGDNRKITVTVHSKGDIIQSTNLVVSDLEGSLFYSPENLINFEDIKPYQSITKPLGISIINNPNLEYVNLVIYYYENPTIPNVKQCLPLRLKVTDRRKFQIALAELPEQIDVFARIAGYLGTFIAGILAVTGKINPVIKSILSNMGFDTNAKRD